jgi:hypothetical protein
MDRLCAPRGRTTTSVSRRMVRSGPIPASSPSGSAVALRGEQLGCRRHGRSP